MWNTAFEGRRSEWVLVVFEILQVDVSNAHLDGVTGLAFLEDLKS